MYDNVFIEYTLYKFIFIYKSKTLLKTISTYFITGLAIVLPIGFTLYILYVIYDYFVLYANTQYALIIVSCLILFILVIGYAASNYSVRLFKYLEDWISKLPLVGLIYKSTKDVTSAFVGSENKFSEPVLVNYGEGLYKIGFITNRDLENLIPATAYAEEQLVAVYFPISFSISGDLYVVSTAKIRPLDAKARVVMQAIISAGLIGKEK